MWWLGAGEERRREPVPCEGLGHGGQPVLAAASKTRHQLTRGQTVKLCHILRGYP